MFKRRRRLGLASLIIVIGLALSASLLADDRVYSLKVILPHESGAADSAQANSLLRNHRLSGMTKENADADKPSIAEQLNRYKQGLSVDGATEINCGSWGSYVKTFMPSAVHKKSSPLYVREVFTDGVTCRITQGNQGVQLEGYDRRYFYGTSLEECILGGYFEPASKLEKTVVNKTKGTVSETYSFQPANPKYYQEEFTVTKKLGNSNKIFYGDSYYVPPKGKKILFAKIFVKAYKSTDGVPCPSDIIEQKFSPTGITQTNHFTLVSAKPSTQVTLTEFIGHDSNVLDTRLGMGKDVNYTWDGSLPTIDQIKEMRAKEDLFFSSGATIAPIAIITGAILIGLGIFLKCKTKRRNANSRPAT